MQEQTNLEFQLGQLTGQVTALVTQVTAQGAILFDLDKRLRDAEKDTTRLMAYAATAGGACSLIVQVIGYFLGKHP